MTFKICKGKHRAKPLYWLHWFPLLFNQKVIRRRVMFYFSAKYNLESEDQADHNKLFGVAFGGVHKNSARFGWRWDIDKIRFVLSAYCYVNGERIMFDLCTAVAMHWYDCSLEITDDLYKFHVFNEKKEVIGIDFIRKGHKKKVGFLLGLFFGGNRAAPSDMTIQIKKI